MAILYFFYSFGSNDSTKKFHFILSKIEGVRVIMGAEGPQEGPQGPKGTQPSAGVRRMGA